MLRQSPSTFGHQHQQSGVKKQKPSPPPRYHDLVDSSEMGIIISPNNPSPRESREADPEKTRDVGIRSEFQPRSASLKLMIIIFALIIISTFAGTFFVITRLNQIEITIKSEIREIKTIIQLKQDLSEDLNHRDNTGEDEYNLLDTRLRLIDLRLQDIIDSQEIPTSSGDITYDAGDKVNTLEYSEDDSDSAGIEEDYEDEEYPGVEEDDRVVSDADDVEGHLGQVQGVTPLNTSFTLDDNYLNYDDKETAASGLE